VSATPLFGAGNSTTASAASGTTLAVSKPANVADGDLLIIYVYSQFTGTVTSVPSGWTAAKTTTNRSGGAYYKAIPSAAAETATTYSWTFSGGGRMCLICFRITGAATASIIDATGAENANQTTATWNVSALTAATAGDLLLVFSNWNNSSTAVSTITPDVALTDGAQVASPATGNTSGIDVAYQQLTSTGSTGTRAITTSPTAAAASGFMIAIAQGGAAYSGSASLSSSSTLTAGGTPTASGAGGVSSASTVSATGVTGGMIPVTLNSSSTVTAGGTPNPVASPTLSTASTLTTSAKVTASGLASVSSSSTLTAHALNLVDQWAAAGMYVAHFGGDVDWPPGMSAFAYAQAAAWNKDMALEMSVWQTLDGVWVVSHDNTTDTLYGTSGVIIPNVNWSAISGLTTTVGGYPILRMIDVLTNYPARTFFIENKGSQDVANWFTLLASYGGGTRIVIKVAAGAMSLPTTARSNGYKIWAYGFQADAANWGTTSSYYDLLGMDYTANSTAWALTVAVGKPILAHIVPSAAAKATAAGLGANGYMASGVQEVVPQTPASVTLASSSTVTAGGVPKFSIATSLSTSSSLTVGGLPKVSTTVALSTSSTLTAVVAGGGSSVSVSSTATLSVGGVASPSGSAALSTASVLTAAGIPAAGLSAALSGISILAVLSSVILNGAASTSSTSTLTVTSGGPPGIDVTVTASARRRWAGGDATHTTTGTLTRRWAGTS
jgi:hypothetical protein